MSLRQIIEESGGRIELIEVEPFPGKESEMDETIIRTIKGAKSLRYEIVHNGTVYARVISLPLAERFLEIVVETAANADVAIRSLMVGTIGEPLPSE